MVRITNNSYSPTPDLGIVHVTFDKVNFSVNDQKPVYAIEFTGKKYQDNQDIAVAKSLLEFSLYAKSGSIIPIAPDHEYSGIPLDTLQIIAYTPTKSQQKTFNLYEDDGEDFLFEKSRFRWIALSYEYTVGISHKIVIRKPKSDFPGSVQNRANKTELVNTDEPKSVSVNNRIITHWHRDRTTRILTVDIDKQTVGADGMIEVKL